MLPGTRAGSLGEGLQLGLGGCENRPPKWVVLGRFPQVVRGWGHRNPFRCILIDFAVAV